MPLNTPMASSSLPTGGSPGGATPPLSPMGGVLDAPPPSPALPQLSQMGGPMTAMGLPPAAGMPPEILTGMLESSNSMFKMLDQFAQMAPDCAVEFQLTATVLQKALDKLFASSGGDVSNVSAGRSFPGGGFDRGY